MAPVAPGTEVMVAAGGLTGGGCGGDGRRVLRSRVPPAVGAPVTVGAGAGDEVRTRDIQLGRLTLCQLSYSRPIRRSLIIPGHPGLPIASQN